MDGEGDAPQYSTLTGVNTQEATNQQTENRQALETLISLQNSFLSNIVSSQQPKPDGATNQGPCVIYYTGPDGELLQGVEQGIPVSQVSTIPTTQIQTLPTIQVQNVNIAVPISTTTVLQNATPSAITQQAGLVPLGANMAATQLNGASVAYVTGSGAGLLSGSGDGLVTIPEAGMVQVPISCIAPASNSGMASVPASSMVSAQSGTLSTALTSLLTSTPASASSTVSTSGVVTNQALSSVRTYTPIAPAPSLPRSSLATIPASSQFVVNTDDAGNQSVITSIVETGASNLETRVVVSEVGQSVGMEASASDASKTQREEAKKRCHVCNKEFCSSQSMLRHLRVLHGVETGPFPSKCAVPGCSASYRCVRELVMHYSADHQANVEVEDLTFDSVDQFMTWKRQEEAVTGAKFPKSTGSSKSSKTHQYLYFSCHRNGSSKPHVKPEVLAKPRKRRKPRGSIKLNSVCLARMSAKIAADGEVTVRYVMTHTNHTLPSGNVHAIVPSLQDARPEEQTSPTDKEGLVKTASVVNVDGEDIGVSAKPSTLSNHGSSNKRSAVVQKQITRINEDIVKLQTHLSSDKVDKAQATHIETVLQSLLLHCGLEEDGRNLNGTGKRKCDVGDGSKIKKVKTLHVCEKCGVPAGRVGPGKRVGRKPGRKPKQQQATQGAADVSGEGKQKARENPYARPTLSQRGTLRSQRFQRRRNKMESEDETGRIQDVEVDVVKEGEQQPTEATDKDSSDGGNEFNLDKRDQQQESTSSSNTVGDCEDSQPSEHLASALLELASHSQQETELSEI
ncbi:pneumococcal serine-rich repeat protein-like [Branchiostoma lanceolatum]|uniref:pneumococcal serine-rich repeat protein-like n=1 Tax=Branchiostoma lanceolatum TaxID=7740 RepID=UPI003452DAA8